MYNAVIITIVVRWCLDEVTLALYRAIAQIPYYDSVRVESICALHKLVEVSIRRPAPPFCLSGDGSSSADSCHHSVY